MFFLALDAQQIGIAFCNLVTQIKKIRIMRKLFLAAIAMLGFAFAAQAQDAKTVKKTETKTVTKQKDDKSVAKTEAKSDVVLKKDGTPDKRYKTSKKVITKKDGTPDMRYKENKTTTKEVTKTTK